MILGSVYWHHISKTDYQGNVKKIDALRFSGFERGVAWIQPSFANSNYNLPDVLAEIINVQYKEKKDREFLMHSFYNDPLNSVGDGLLYLPLYNRLNKKKESFLIISAGIDGKLNSKFTVGDTIYDDDYFNKFDFYNLEEYADRKSMKFNFWYYLFGSKDYLIRYHNCVNDCNIAPMTMEYEKYRMHPHGIKSRICLIAAFEKDTLIDNQRTIVLKSWIDGYRAYCKMHRPIQKKIVRGDTLMIAGFLENISEDGDFYMTHSILKGREEFWNYSFTDLLKDSELDKRQLLKRNEILKME